MRKTKQGTKEHAVWKAACQECGCEYEESAGELRIEDDRDGQFARSQCPECESDLFFYPPQTRRGSSRSENRSEDC
jgi:hypothetical protein